MKTCPVCNAAAFDDALICYGCMHRFDDDAEPTTVPSPGSPAEPVLNLVSPDSPTEAIFPIAPPEFRIRFIPMRDPSGALTWNCTVEA